MKFTKTCSVFWLKVTEPTGIKSYAENTRSVRYPLPPILYIEENSVLKKSLCSSFSRYCSELFSFLLLLSVFLLEVVYILETDAACSISVVNVVLGVCGCSSTDLYFQSAPRVFS